MSVRSKREEEASKESRLEAGREQHGKELVVGVTVAPGRG